MSSRRIRFMFEYLLYRQLTLAAAILPRPVAMLFGGLVGRVCSVLAGSRRRLSEQNMQRALPELSRHQVKTEIRQMFRHLGILAMDVLAFRRFHEEPDLDRYFEFENLESLEQAHAHGKGVLVLTAHLGNWEAGSCFLPRLGYPTCFIAKKLKNPRMNAFIQANREQCGAEMIDAKKGARRILKALADGKVVCVLLDQHHREGVLTEFFNRPVLTSPMLVQLAMKSGAPILPAFTLRADDHRYHTCFADAFEVEPNSDPELIRRQTQLCNDYIEEAVRKKPSQWFWLHNRWRVDAPATATMKLRSPEANISPVPAISKLKQESSG